MLKLIQMKSFKASLRNLFIKSLSLPQGMLVVFLTASLLIVLTPSLAIARPGGSVQLISPYDGETVFTKRPSLDWSKVGKAQSYQIQVATSAGFNPLVVDATVTEDKYLLTENLLEGTDYYWRVKYIDRKGTTSDWSVIWSFTINSDTIMLKRHPYLQSPAVDSATIAWTTTSAGTGEVQLFSDGGSYTMVQAQSTFFSNATTDVGYDFTLYAAEITSLTSNTSYSYKILVNGADLTPAGPLTFTTASDSTSSFSFAAFGDSGTGSANQLSVRDQMLQHPVDFYIHTGDIAYSDGTYEEIETTVFDIYRDNFKRAYFNPSPGNHDYHTNSGQPYLDSYLLPEQALRPAHQERYYSFDWGNAHFVALDSNDPLDETDSNFTEDMFDWLRADLQDANDRGLFWKIVYFHHPAYSSGTLHGSNTQVQQKLVPIFELFGVNLVLNGHDHEYERTCSIAGNQCTSADQGVTYIVTAGGGASLYNVGQSWFTDYADSLHHFVKVDVNFQGQECLLQTQGIDTSGTVFDQHIIDRCSPQPPVANAGPDQNIIDADGNGEEDVILDGSSSFDLDGSISSYAWYEDAILLATGVNPPPPVTMALGTHTITLKVTDNEGLTDSDEVIIAVTEPSTGEAIDMYVWDIVFESRLRGKGGAKHDERIYVIIRRDSDDDGVAEFTDEPVSSASVSVKLIGPVGGSFSGTTNSSGEFRSSWVMDMLDGTYTAEVYGLSHDAFIWEQNLDPTANDADEDGDDFPDQQHTNPH